MTSYFERAGSYVHTNVQKGREYLQKGQGNYPDGGKAGQMKCCTDEPEEQKADYIVTLQWDLANTYYWSGNFIQDFFFFVAQWHPLLGIFLCHPYHPWTKRERFQMLLVSTFLTMPLSVVAAKAAKEAQSAKSLITLMSVVFVTIPDTIIGVLLYQLSIANTRCPNCASFWNFIDKVCMNCCTVFGIFIAGFVCYLLKCSDPDLDWFKAFKPLLMGKLYSYASWFVIWFFLPCMGFLHEWWMEKKVIQQAEEQQALNSNPDA